MDKKEAIKILENICLEDWGHYPEHIEAFKEAIRALEALDKIQEITREAIIKSNTPIEAPYAPLDLKTPIKRDDQGNLWVTINENSGIPDCCKNCSNHPSNGGNGICNCTLPYFEDPIKWSVQGNMTIGDWAELAEDTKYVSMLEVLNEDNHED